MIDLENIIDNMTLAEIAQDMFDRTGEIVCLDDEIQYSLLTRMENDTNGHDRSENYQR